MKTFQQLVSQLKEVGRNEGHRTLSSRCFHSHIKAKMLARQYARTSPSLYFNIDKQADFLPRGLPFWEM